MYWTNLLHIYQPIWQKPAMLQRIIRESYQPIIDWLIKHPQINITLNIQGVLVDLLAKYDKPLLNKIILLVNRQQIELTGSAQYHAFLPLLSKTEIVRQIRLNEQTLSKYFKQKFLRRGFFLPEMAYHPKIVSLLEQIGYQWIILDEIAFSGKIGQVNFNQAYQIKTTKIKVVFRQQTGSNFWHSGAIKTITDFWQQLTKDNRIKNFLITACDGENLGHHQPAMLPLWQQAISSQRVTTLTISQLLAKYKKTVFVEPVKCSWASREIELQDGIPYLLWQDPNNPIHQLQWQLTNLVIKEITKQQKDINYLIARRKLDRALFSCQYWWASASPWWEPKFIRQGAKELIIAYQSLNQPANKISKLLINIKNKMYQQIEQWEKVGVPQKIKQAYLHGEKTNHYFSGKIIN